MASIPEILQSSEYDTSTINGTVTDSVCRLPLPIFRNWADGNQQPSQCTLGPPSTNWQQPQGCYQELIVVYTKQITIGLVTPNHVLGSDSLSNNVVSPLSHTLNNTSLIKFHIIVVIIKIRMVFGRV